MAVEQTNSPSNLVLPPPLLADVAPRAAADRARLWPVAGRQWHLLLRAAFVAVGLVRARTRHRHLGIGARPHDVERRLVRTLAGNWHFRSPNGHFVHRVLADARTW